MIFLANSSRQSIGGGWSWIDNFKKSITTTDNYEQAKVYLIPSPSMVQRDEVQKAKDDGKKIVLRLDNAVRNSRNRNTGMSRLYDFAQLADAVIYQSLWAKEYLEPFVQRDGKVILNSVDESIFKDHGQDRPPNFLYSRYNRDETKNWEMARYLYSQMWNANKNTHLYIVGQFSQELRDANFDFYMGESFQYLGVLDAHSMAKIYNQTRFLIYTYFNDACSNTLIEALMCGCEPMDMYGMLESGGAAEIMLRWNEFGRSYFELERMAKEYEAVIRELL